MKIVLRMIVIALLLQFGSLGRAGVQTEGEEFFSEAEQLFLTAKPDQLDEAWLPLEKNSERSRLELLLAQRAQANVKVVAKSSEMKRLGRVFEERAELDEARAQALELILDEELYFYPYAVPQVDGTTAARYKKVQAKVMDRVHKVHKLWQPQRKIGLGRQVRSALQSLEWVRAQQQAEFYSLPDFAEWLGKTPEWALWQSPDLKQVTIVEFALSEEEALRLRSGQIVRELNESNWKQQTAQWQGHEHFLEAIKAEQEQVRLTNDYRVMMGFTALAWNPRLQRAAQVHSEYMSQHSVLSHVQEQNEAAYDMSKRALAVEYEHINGENISYGRTDPLKLLNSWFRSSAHHRNMLDVRHTEIASARVGKYWTQNYGSRYFEARTWEP